MPVESVIPKTETYDDAEQATGERSWLILFSDGPGSTAPTAAEALGAPGVAAKGEAFDADHPTTVVVAINYELTGRRSARVVATYEGPEPDEGGDTTPTGASPLDEPPQFRFGGSLTSEPFFRDVDDQLMTTSAGEEFADLPVRVRPQFTISITRNRSSFNHGTAAAAIPMVNAAATLINGTTYAERTLRLDNVTAEGPLERNGVTYWRVTTNLTARAITWDVLLEDRGLYETDDDGQLVPILDANGSPVLTPYPLNGSGKARPNPTDAPAIIDRRAYEVGSLDAWI